MNITDHIDMTQLVVLVEQDKDIELQVILKIKAAEAPVTD